MSDKDSAFGDSLIIRYRGLYDYDGLLSLIRGYFAEQELETQEPKFKFKLSGAGSEADFRIKGERLVSSYIKVELQVDGHAWDVKRKTVELDGEKKVMTEGKIQLIISSTVILDYSDSFNTSKVKSKSKKMLTEWMHSRLDSIDGGMQFAQNYVDGKTFLRGMVNGLDKAIKEHLRMECY